MDKPGCYNGKHYTTYVPEIKLLKQKKDYKEVEKLLFHLVDATEAEDRVELWGVAPWYYEELAKLYRASKDIDAEIKILERFAKQRHAPGVKPKRLMERLEKAKSLKAKSKDSSLGNSVRET